MADMMNVWAVVEHGAPIQKIQQPIPEPKGTEVVIKTTHCGVCHSDLHFWEGFYDFGKGKRFYVKDRGVKLPIAMGHEVLGTVARAGPDAGSIALGSRQIVYPWLGCGNCDRCAREEDNMCVAQKSLSVVANGGFAEYVVVPHPKYLVDPGDCDPAVACTFGCSGVTTMNAIDKIMPMDPNEAVVLIGAGGVGLAAVAMLRAYDHKNIISVDIDDSKLEAATKAGATKVVNSSGSDPAKAITAAAGGLVMAVIDFVNNTATAAMVQTILNKGAKWVQVGIMGGSTEISLPWTIFRGITIYGNITGDVKHLREVTRLAREGKLPAFAVKKMPWEQAPEALEILQQGKAAGRIVLVKE